MVKAKRLLEIYDSAVWQAFDEYPGLTADRFQPIAHCKTAHVPYFLNDQNRQDEMLVKFVGIADESDLLYWLQDYGLTDSRTNWSVGELFNQISIMRWLINLLNAAIDESDTANAYLQDHVTTELPRTNLMALSQFKRDQLGLLETKIDQHKRHPDLFPAVTADEEMSYGFIQERLQQFEHLYITVGFRHDFLPYWVQLTISKREWKKTNIEQLRLIARAAVARKAGFEMAVHSSGARISADLTADPKTGLVGLIPSFEVHTPWQAMSYALYKRALQNKGLELCHYCSKPFTRQRGSAKYCPPPAKCKDDFNNEKKAAVAKKRRFS